MRAKGVRTKSWTREGQGCTHTRNGCGQKKHTSHPDIKRTRRSRSRDTHLTRHYMDGTGNIRKTGICTGISYGRLCTHRSKRRRRWPTIMPMGATIRRPLRPWGDQDLSQCPAGEFQAGGNDLTTAERRAPHPPLGPGRALPLTRLDSAYKSCRPAAFHVGQGLFTGQGHLRGILWKAEK